jgi:hypothetical protein
MPFANEPRRGAHHEREVRLAYERGRDESHTFPALLFGILIGALSVSAAVWIL